MLNSFFFFFFQAEDGIRDLYVTGVPDVCSSDLASSALARRCLQREHMRGQEVREQPLQARFPELSTQMRKLEQVVQIVDRVTESADFTELLFSIFQVLLNFFEL